ncbi:5432_t:CDS:10 [Entrophospora sp. SA101]|nr:5432_t:CDS:10 [Entrophospora sp. SA101]
MNYSQPSALSPDYNNFIKHNVYYNEPEYYIIKGYDDIISYKREIDALISLKGAKNIMQIIDYDSHKIVVVSECALYDLETFFDHQAWTQRQAEKMPIIKVIHLDLSPKNIMYFRDENWKLIDFDSACIADKTHVSKTTTIKYCSPELIQAEEDGKWIKAQFSMDMFSFGLILYYIENGYWNIADQKCPDKKLPITTIDEPYAADVIEKLLEKNVNNRMTLAQFKETTYYKKLSKFNDAQDDFNHAQNKTIVEESKYSLLEKAYHEKCKMQIEKEAKELNPDIKDDELKQMNVDLQQERFLLFLERYHQEMKISLKDMNKKLDEVKTSVLNLTETIPRMNEKTPRVFIMVPQRREFKNPMTWYTNPFRMYFVCEHNNNWHVPEQEGYVITKVPEFIKKYGPWIQLCIEALVFGLRVATSNLFPQEIGNILSGIFNVKIDNSDEIVQYFQEIIDTIGVGVKEINDNNPDLVPLERDRESNYQVLNASGIRALASFVKSKQNSENFGGLVQCIDKKNQNVIWLCSEHRNDNDYTLKDEPQSPHSPHPSNRNSTIMYGSHLHHPSSSRSYFPTSPTPPTSPPPSIQPSRNFTLGSTHSFNNNQNYYNNNGHDNYPNCEDDGPFSSQPISRSDSLKQFHEWCLLFAFFFNEKTPRVFIMVPERREFKNPMSWYTNPFRMYFVCEHNNNWHVPEQEGYVITKVPEFIKKYGPWIQLCIEALVFGLRVATSNLFPQEIGNILSGIFNVKIDNSDEIVQYFQEIIDTIGVGVKEINDNNPDLVPLERDRESNYQVLNASGIRALASFVKSKQNSENFGGLVQCIDKKNQNVIWLCSEHRNDNDYTLKDEPQSPHSPHPSNRNSTIMYGSHLHHPSSSRSYFPTSPTPPTSPPPSIQPSRNFTLGSTHSFNNNQNYYNNNGHDNYPNCEDDGPFSSQPISRSDSRESSLIMDINYPVPLIYFVNDILVDVLNNALSSDCAHFGIDEIKKETHNMRENLAGLAQFYQNWLNSQQKRLLNTILKRIIKLTNALNEFYAESIICLESNDRKGIEQNLNKLDSSSKILNKYSQYNKLMKNNALKEWYIISKTSMIHDECDGEDRENKDEYKQVFNDILVIKNRMLKGNIPVFGKELDPECFNDEDNINCIEKEIYMYSEQHLNDSDYILKFLGFTVDKFKPILHYEYANYGNLYEYLKNNQTLPENEKLTLDAKLNLSLDICFGLEFLHERHILHLDLRSSNIYLFKNGYENEFLKPKISNFLYSVDTLNNHTTVKPCLPKSIDNQVRKRWHEPQRLKNEKYNCTFESDYYSLGMLLWEIFHATGALPYEKIKIENLYEHLRSKNGPENYILKFLGFTVDKFKPILHYEYANYGNLYEYLKNNQTLPENEKLTLNAKLNLSLDICFGLEFLHERHILHLDLRSSNIYLFKNGYENEFLKPKISNFLYSVDTLNNHTTVKPCLPKSIDNQVRKRWHEPQRLKNEKYNCTFESDYYSLGMLLWEIFHATGALPYEKIKIENLYEHLRSKNGPESLPNNLLEQLYEHLKNGYEGFPKNLHKSLLSKITKLWEYNINGRTTVTAMIAILRRFNKKRRTISSSTRCTISTISTFSTVSTDKTAVNTKYVTKSEEVIQRYIQYKGVLTWLTLEKAYWLIL